MDYVISFSKKCFAILCFLNVFGTVTESKGEFKVITLGQQSDPISRQTIDISAKSLTVTKNGLVYLPTLLGLRAYNIMTGKQVFEIPLPSRIEKKCSIGAKFRNKIEFLDDEKSLIMNVGCEIIRVDMNNFSLGEVLFTLGEDGSLTNSFAISPDRKLLAVSTNYCITCIWDLTTHKMIAEYKPGSEKLGDLAFSPDGKKLLINGSQIWDREKNSLKKLEGIQNTGYKVAWLSDNINFISAGLDRYAVQQNSITGKVKARYNQSSRTDRVAISPNERFVATGGWEFKDHRVKLFDATSGKLLKTFEGHTGSILDVTFSPDSKKLISSSVDGTIRIWNIN
jgi:WD40 repeat protein